MKNILIFVLVFSTCEQKAMQEANEQNNCNKQQRDINEIDNEYKNLYIDEVKKYFQSLVAYIENPGQFELSSLTPQKGYLFVGDTRKRLSVKKNNTVDINDRIDAFLNSNRFIKSMRQTIASEQNDGMSETDK